MAKSAKASIRKIAVALAAICLPAVGLFAFLSPDRELFSSSSSPDGLLVVENYMVDGCGGSCATGLIVLRKRDGGSKAQVDLPEPDPNIFFQWIDDTHLQILTQDRRPTVRLDTAEELDGVHIATGTYPAVTAEQSAAGMAYKVVHELHEADVSASFSKEVVGNGEVCRLKVIGNHGGEFEKLGIEIDAVNNQCILGEQGLPNCAGMTSRFWVAEPSTAARRLILTSADVSGAHGYGVLPTSNDHMTIRGQFLNTSATLVANRLRSGQFSIDYNFGFSNLSVRYLFPPASIKGPTLSFLRCIGATGVERPRQTVIRRRQ
jgi:hypothetical protein